jgi:hypothetical protein
MPVKKSASLGRRTASARRVAASRPGETPEQTCTRLDDQSTRQATTRAAETPQQRRTRSEDQRRRQTVSRAAQWTFMEREAFQYDPASNYDSHPQLSIGQMTDICL